MIKIKVFSDFSSPETATQTTQDIFLNGGNTYKNICFVKDETYTHAVIINTAMPELKNIPKKNVIGLAFEPIEFLKLTIDFVEYAQKYIGVYFFGKDARTAPFMSHFSFMWFTKKRQEYLNRVYFMKKAKPCISIWVSDKTQSPGHKYRHGLVKEILRTNLPIDIWGRGCKMLNSTDPRIKGEFTHNEPYREYKYCITIENHTSESYISEKFMNCLAFNTIPIYWGAIDVEKYFGENCCVKLTGNMNVDMEIIKNAIDEKYNIDLSRARKELYEGDCYFPEFLYKHFDSLE